MIKKYLMNGLAALAIVAGISSCTKDVTAMSPVDEAQKAKENAELQLGFEIPDGQTWDMASRELYWVVRRTLPSLLALRQQLNCMLE